MAAPDRAIREIWSFMAGSFLWPQLPLLEIRMIIVIGVDGCALHHTADDYIHLKSPTIDYLLTFHERCLNEEHHS